MKLYTAFVCAVMMFTLSAHAGPAPKEVVIVNLDGDPVPVTDSSSGGGAGNSHIEFLGFSPTLHAGGDGLPNLYRACGLGARMCTTAEIVNSTDFPRPVWIFDAWVRSSPVAEAVAVSQGRVSFLDASGLVFEGNAANCGGWSDGSITGRGMTVSPEFAFSAHPCNESLPVACCGTAP